MSYALFVRGYGAKDPGRAGRLIQAAGLSPGDARPCIADLRVA